LRHEAPGPWQGRAFMLLYGTFTNRAALVDIANVTPIMVWGAHIVLAVDAALGRC